MKIFLMNAITIAEIGADNRQEVEIVVKGEFPHEKGLQVIDDDTITRIVNQIKNWARDLVIDYEHESLTPGVRAPAAGWIKYETVKAVGNGITAIIEWTNEAAGQIREKKYRFLSPVFDVSKGQIMEFFNAALTNNPNIHALKPLTNEIKKENEMEGLQKIIEALGLQPEAGKELTANDIVTAIVKMKAAKPEGEKKDGGENDSGEPEAAVQLNDLLGALDVKDIASAKRIITELQKPPATSAEEIVRMKNDLAELNKIRMENAVKTAMEAGKIAPSQEKWAREFAMDNPDGFRKFLVNQPVVVPLGKSPADNDRKPAGESTLTEYDKKLCNEMGISEKDFLETKKANLSIN